MAAGQSDFESKSDLDFIINFSIISLLTPAIIGGAIIRQKLRSSCSLLIVTSDLKYLTLRLVRLALILFYFFNLNYIILYNKFI